MRWETTHHRFSGSPPREGLPGGSRPASSVAQSGDGGGGGGGGGGGVQKPHALQLQYWQCLAAACTTHHAEHSRAVPSSALCGVQSPVAAAPAAALGASIPPAAAAAPAAPATLTSVAGVGSSHEGGRRVTCRFSEQPASLHKSTQMSRSTHAR